MELKKYTFASDKDKKAFKEAATKMVYLEDRYTADEEYMPIMQLIEEKTPPYYKIDIDEEAVVTAVFKKDKINTFLVMRFTRLDGKSLDLPLSYNHSFEEGDTVAVEDLIVRSEVDQKDETKKHYYVTKAE